jgi:uncharacterized protein YjbJ (UPF0337 family)
MQPFGAAFVDFSHTQCEGNIMNEDRIKGSITKAAGHIKQAAGSALGDAKLQADGKMDVAEGSLQNLAGSIKDIASEAFDAAPQSIQQGLKKGMDAIKAHPKVAVGAAIAAAGSIAALAVAATKHKK